MKLKDLATKPQLVEIIINSPALVEKYGEELSFHVHDRLPVGMYSVLASLDSKDPGAMYNIMKDLILDESGAPVLSEDYTLPMDLMNEAILRVTETLGK